MTTQSHFDPQPFKDFEQAGWNSTADKYNRHFGHLTIRYCRPLLDAAGVTKGTRVLDVATGPGYVAAVAAERGADATGVDFASNMVIEARKLHPNATFEEGDAENLPFPDAQFDAVVMGFGMLHVARPERVLEELYRVLRPGGRAAFTVWGDPETAAIGPGILLRAVEACGVTDVGIPPGPPMFRFSDHGETRSVMTAAGFSDIEITDISYDWELAGGDDLLTAFSEAAVRAGQLLRLQNQESLVAIKAFVVEEANRYERDGVIRIPMGAVLAAGRKPTATKESAG
jgi:SAM-dependent methyltransferase